MVKNHKEVTWLSKRPLKERGRRILSARGRLRGLKREVLSLEFQEGLKMGLLMETV
jgi:hypothetical protein